MDHNVEMFHHKNILVYFLSIIIMLLCQVNVQLWRSLWRRKLVTSRAQQQDRQLFLTTDDDDDSWSLKPLFIWLKCKEKLFTKQPKHKQRECGACNTLKIPVFRKSSGNWVCSSFLVSTNSRGKYLDLQLHVTGPTSVLETKHCKFHSMLFAWCSASCMIYTGFTTS